MIVLPFTLPLAVMTKTSLLRNPAPTNIPMETLGARSRHRPSRGSLGLAECARQNSPEGSSTSYLQPVRGESSACFPPSLCLAESKDGRLVVAL